MAQEVHQFGGQHLTSEEGGRIGHIEVLQTLVRRLAGGGRGIVDTGDGQQPAVGHAHEQHRHGRAGQAGGHERGARLVGGQIHHAVLHELAVKGAGKGAGGGDRDEILHGYDSRDAGLQELRRQAAEGVGRAGLGGLATAQEDQLQRVVRAGHAGQHASQIAGVGRLDRVVLACQEERRPALLRIAAVADEVQSVKAAPQCGFDGRQGTGSCEQGQLHRQTGDGLLQRLELGGTIDRGQAVFVQVARIGDGHQHAQLLVDDLTAGRGGQGRETREGGLVRGGQVVRRAGGAARLAQQLPAQDVQFRGGGIDAQPDAALPACAHGLVPGFLESRVGQQPAVQALTVARVAAGRLRQRAGIQIAARELAAGNGELDRIAARLTVEDADFEVGVGWRWGCWHASLY